MKNILFLFILPLLLTSCVTYTGTYKVGLQEVESPKNIKEQFGETKIVNFQDKGVTKYSYEDTLIKIIWLPTEKQFVFNLTNKSDHSMKIVWDETVYVDENGASQKVIHAGVKYSEMGASQPSTTIVKGAYLDDLIMPTGNVHYVSGQYGGWSEKPLFNGKAYSNEQLEALKASYLGKVVKILLPIKIEDTINEYLFTFKIEDFIPQSTTY
jgi:hypothetical protein